MKTILFAAIVGLASATTLHAAPRNSANYRISADGFDGGGRPGSSAAYTTESSAGGFAGVSSTGATAETAKSGFIGQLYEVVGLAITGASAVVNVGDSLFLRTWQTLDDGTLLAPPEPFAMQWFLNGDAVPGATSSSYTIPAVAQANAGSYTVVALNSGQSATSNSANVVVNGGAVATAITSQPLSQMVSMGNSVTFTVAAIGSPTPTFQWKRNGIAVVGATGSSYSIASVTAGDAGFYTVEATGGTTVNSEPAAIGIATTSKVVGAASEVGANILHPSGNIYDQILLQGAAATITADPGQVTRISYVDLSDDIVQVEFAGAGSLSIVLENPSGPAAPVNYNQPSVGYMKGHAGIVIAGANETTHVAVFSVGRINAVNRSLFKDGVPYDGLADIAFISIQSANGRFGGIRTANTHFFASRGVTGIHAPGVHFDGPVFVGDINAFDTAEPVLVLGSANDTRVAGGDFLQANGRPVKVGGLTQLKFVDGSTSHGVILPGQTIQGRLHQDGVDVTDLIARNPAL